MPPRARGHNGRKRASTSDAALRAADRVISRAAEYRQGPARIQATSYLLAERIAHNGDVEKALMDQEDGDENENESKASSFLRKCRTRLKDLASENMRRMNHIECFLSAVESARDEIRAQAPDDDQNDDSPPPDYERKILGKIESSKRNSDNAGCNFDGGDYCRDMRQHLGEKEKPKKKRRSAAGSDDEDDLEVMNTSNPSSLSALKCPITGILFEDPVKSRVCHHIYSKAGIQQMFRNKKRKCPVSGCANQLITDAQLDPDLVMAMKVKAYKRRQKQKSYEDNVDDNYEDIDTKSFTVID